MGTKKNSLYFNMMNVLDPTMVKIVHRFMTGCERFQLIVLEYVGRHKGNEKLPKYFYFWTNQNEIITVAGSGNPDVDTEFHAGHLYLRDKKDWVRYSPVVSNLPASDSSGREYRNETQFDAFTRALAGGMEKAVIAIVVGLVGDEPAARPTLHDIRAFTYGYYKTSVSAPDLPDYKINQISEEIYKHLTGVEKVPERNLESLTYAEVLERCCEFFGDPFEEK